MGRVTVRLAIVSTRERVMNRMLRGGMPWLLGLSSCLGAAASGQESWDVIHVQGQRVGTLHVRVEPLKDKAGHALQRVRVDMDLKFKRAEGLAHLTQRWGTIETPDGQILSLDVRTKPAESETRTFGVVKDGVMKLTVAGGGNSQTSEIPWGDDVRGPYGAEMSFSRSKIKAGETRKIRTFIADFNRICVTTLVADKLEEIELGPKNAKRTLMRVESTIADLDGKAHLEMTATMWVDDTGQILKTHSEMLGGTDFYRTTFAGAARGAGTERFDLLAASIIKCRVIPQAESVRSIVYRVTTKGDAVTDLFPNDRRQTAMVGATKATATLLVNSLGKDEGSAEAEPGPEYLRPNPLIDSEDATVVAHTRRAVGKIVDPWAKAVAIEHWVAVNIKDKNFNVGFAPAREVAAHLEGDCSEHSVLVAAMCRAAGIPARCVVGVVYSEKVGGFGPHMWNEVYVNKRWVAIDAAFDQSVVDPTHLKISASSLDGIAPFEVFTPVLTLFGQVKIEPIEIR